MAEALNAKANEAYKRGDLKGAQSLYEKASKTDTKNPKYQSNLSAVLFEQGKYSDAISTVQKAWDLLEKGEGRVDAQKPLAIKLATRFTKASFFGGRLPSASGSLEDFLSEASSDSEMAKYRKGVKEKEASLPLTKEALARAQNASVFKSPMELYRDFCKSSQDAPCSLFNGFNDSRSCPIRRAQLDAEEKERISFLFGGVGDGRHAFATLIHQAQAQWTKNLHMTLLDIHPSVIAKLLIIFRLLEQVGSATGAEEAELYMTLAGLSRCLVVPKYCSERYSQKTMHSLLDEILSKSAEKDQPIKLAKWLWLPRTSVAPVCASLEQWLAVRGKTATGMINAPSFMGPAVTPCFKEMDQDELMEVMARIQGFESYGANAMTGRGNAPGKGSIKRAKEDVYDDFEFESQWFKRLKICLPPKELLDRHPAMKEALASKTVTDALLDRDKDEIDRSDSEGRTQGYPQYLGNPFDSIQTFYDSVQELTRPSRRAGRTLYLVYREFFKETAKALKRLEDHVTIECVVENLVGGLSRLVTAKDRPSAYPSTYTRMIVSNIPDYTGGILTMGTSFVPYLHRSASHLVITNNYLNSPAFNTWEHQNHHYIRLVDSEMERFFGCKIINAQDTPREDMLVQFPPHHPGSKEPPLKDHLYTWLSRVLLLILGPCPPARGSTRALIRLLIYLHEYVHIPAHWLTDFLASLVNDTLVTRTRPYPGILPVPLSYSDGSPSTPYRVNLDPWKAELRLAISDLAPIIPFPLPVDMEAGYILQPTNVISLRASVMVGPFAMEGMTHTPIVGLAFFKFDKRGESINELLEGRGLATLLTLNSQATSKEKKAKLQILLSPTRVSLLKRREVEWRVERELHEMMVKEGWEMVVFRTDYGDVVTRPVEVKRLTVVQ
ncbi:hypothetical protein BKA70DRAFT_1329301 [Coprinopsis sp. MPI-PUGE-AT-0042]|nr:hypothetical protein BKA70DRAFT_1329301 [Coprinopsis sp. MPI-PUGE-AT-0042]